jgi:Tfp pilus assembly protein PilF
LAAASPSRLESVEAVKKIAPPEVKLLARSAAESPAAKSVEKAAPVMETAVVRSRPMVEERSQTTAAVKASSPPAETAAPSPVAVSSRRPQAAAAPPAREKSPAQPSPVLPSSAARTATQYFQLGQVAQRDGDWTGAETYYLAGLKEMPDHVKMLTNLSAVYIRQNRFEEAGRILERARSLAPGDVSVLVNLGNVELGQKRYDRARAWFLQAVQIDPGSETALNNLAYLAQLRGDLTEMETYYQKILAVSPKNSEVLLALAGALEKKERWQEAIACYERSLEIERVREDRELAGRIKNRIRLLNRMDSERAGADRSTQQP